MAKKGAIFIKNDLIFSTVYPPFTLFKGKKEAVFTWKEKGKGKSPVYLINPYQNATLVD